MGLENKPHFEVDLESRIGMLVWSRDHVQLAESELSEYDKHGFRFYAITFTISVLYSSETTLSVEQGIHL